MLEAACMREELPPQAIMAQPGYQIPMAPPPIAPPSASPGAANVATLPLVGDYPPVSTAQQQAIITPQAPPNQPPERRDEDKR